MMVVELGGFQHCHLGALTKRNSFPSAPFSFCVRGSKSKVPAKVSATVISGDVTNPCVAGLASLRPVKLRLYDVTIVFFSPFLTFYKKVNKENVKSCWSICRKLSRNGHDSRL